MEFKPNPIDSIARVKDDRGLKIAPPIMECVGKAVWSPRWNDWEFPG